MSKTLTVVEIAEAAQLAAAVTATSMQLQSTVQGLSVFVAAEGGNPVNLTELSDARLWEDHVKILKNLDKLTKIQMAKWKKKGISF